MDERFTNATLFEMPFEIRTGLAEFEPETKGVVDLESVGRRITNIINYTNT